MEELEAFMESLAGEYDRKFEQLDVNVAFDALGSTPPKDCTTCSIHARIDSYEYDPSEEMQLMQAVTYVGEYAVYTDDDRDDLPKDPFVLVQMLVMPEEELIKAIGYAVKVYWVGEQAIQHQGEVGAIELSLKVGECYRAKMLHDDIVQVLRDGGDGNDLRDLYNK